MNIAGSTRNMASVIASHNQSILKLNDKVYGCNCRVRNACPLQHKCVTPEIVSQAASRTIKTTQRKYIMIHVELILRKGSANKLIPIKMKQNILITFWH